MKNNTKRIYTIYKHGYSPVPFQPEYIQELMDSFWLEANPGDLRDPEARKLYRYIINLGKRYSLAMRLFGAKYRWIRPSKYKGFSFD